MSLPPIDTLTLQDARDEVARLRAELEQQRTRVGQRFPEPIEWKGQTDMDCAAEEVWSRLSSELSNYGWDVDSSPSFFDGFAQGRNAAGLLDGSYWAFRIDHPERKPLVVMVQMDWDADSDGERYVDKSRVQRIEVRRV